MTPKLPVEIQLDILDLSLPKRLIGPFIVERYQTLVQLSLVCRLWNRFAPRELYRFIVATRREIPKRLLEVASIRPDLAALATELCVRGDHAWIHESAFDSGVQKLLEKCSNIEALVLERIQDFSLAPIPNTREHFFQKPQFGQPTRCQRPICLVSYSFEARNKSLESGRQAVELYLFGGC